MWKTSVIWLAAVAVAMGDLSEKPHPRLWLTTASEGSMRKKISADPLATKLQTAIMAEANQILKDRTCRYEIPDGKRLLAESRRALNNILHCAWAWRFSGDEKFRLRTIAELEAACALKDWNPSHFLDTAEMATAVATGYDWLYPTLTPKQREMCEHAIVEKALKPAKKIYDSGGWWSKPHNNWSQVCGSGIAIAAAAVAGHDDGLSENLFARGLTLVEGCVNFYAPDGMYPEGPGYWHYGTDYHVMLLAACGPLGQNIMNPPLLEKGADAIMHLTSATGLPFNFADSHATVSAPSPAQSWLADHYQNATQAGYVRGFFANALENEKKVSGLHISPLTLLWLPNEPSAGKSQTHAAVFHGEQAVALFRTGWDSQAAWFAIKGGTPAASHGHMDVGSFCYDTHGIRWIQDLGSDDYNLPGYFSKERFSYYRLQNRSHNTLEIAGKLQNANSKPCPLTQSSITGNSLTATFDLSNAYANAAKKVIRSSRFQADTGLVRIDDEITEPSGDVIWRAFTDADCHIKGNSVILNKKGQQITIARISNSGTWSITHAKPPTAKENQNQGITAVVLTVPKANQIALQIEIQP